MKLLSKIYKDKGVDFPFPLEVRDDDGNITYHENENGAWEFEYDAKGNLRSIEDSKGCIWDIQSVLNESRNCNIILV